MKNLLLKKIGFKHGMRSILVSTPSQTVKDLRDTDGSRRLIGSFDYIHVFVKDQDHLDAAFPRLKRHLKTGGMLWVSWPKNKQLDTDLTMTNVIRIGYNHGLVESKCISVNSIWSGIKFTLPIKGKSYNNSYGQLKH